VFDEVDQKDSKIKIKLTDNELSVRSDINCVTGKDFEKLDFSSRN